MTARDFTPTDEQWEGIASQWFNAPWEGATEHERASLVAAARELTALPAFQSIIAAAKAEGFEEGVDAYRDWSRGAGKTLVNPYRTEASA